jgi:hypothetical protein
LPLRFVCINIVYTFDPKRNAKRKMGAMRNETTAKDLGESTGVKPDTFRMRWNKLRETKPEHFACSFDVNAPLSPVQIECLLNAGKNQMPQLSKKPIENSVLDNPAPAATVGAVIKPTANPSGLTKWPLWAAFIITAGASIPNMVEVTQAIKGSGLVAWSLTFAFTLSPFLLILSRAKGLFKWAVVIGVMGYTAFCNTASIFGGLTSLDKGYIMHPTVFLEAVTNMMNTDYLNTARTLAALMALLIGAIEFVAFKNLAK